MVVERVVRWMGVGGAHRVGGHVALLDYATSMSDVNPQKLLSYGARALCQLRIAVIFPREALGEHSLTAQIRSQFGGPVIVNENYDIATAHDMVAAGQADAVAFGKAFIANPDLVARLKAGAPLNDWDPNTFYSAGAQGYIDYPSLSGTGLPQKETCA